MITDQRISRLALLWLGIGLLLGACSPEPPSGAAPCTSGQTIECPCQDGRRGTQTCLASGTFSACQCLALDATPGTEDRASTSDVSMGSEDRGSLLANDVPSDSGDRPRDVSTFDAEDARPPMDVFDAGTHDRPVVLDALDSDVPPPRDVLRAVDGMCPPDAALCGSEECVDLRTDINHCGRCGRVCPSWRNSRIFCENGACQSMCLEWFGNCNADIQTDGCETSLLMNDRACGRCGSYCLAVERCVMGRCVPR